MPDSEINAFAKAAAVLASITDHARSAGETHSALDKACRHINEHAEAMQRLNIDFGTAQSELSKTLREQINQLDAHVKEEIQRLGRRLDDRYAEMKGQHEAFRSTLDARLSQEIGNLSRSIEGASAKLADAQNRMESHVNDQIFQLRRRLRVVSILGILFGLLIAAGVAVTVLKQFGYLE